MMRDASSNAAGCPIWKVGAKSIVSTWRCTALDDGLAAMAGIDAPEPGGGVEHAPAVAGDVVHAFGADDQARVPP